MSKCQNLRTTLQTAPDMFLEIITTVLITFVRSKDTPNTAEASMLSTMTECGLLDDINSAGYRLKFHAKSLIKNVNNTSAERYNSIKTRRNIYPQRRRKYV
jgi:hypothetical protein